MPPADAAARASPACNTHLPCLHAYTPSQVTAVSSAGVVFAKLVEVPPITLAAWRLQLTSVFLGVGAVVQLSRMPPADRARTLQQVRVVGSTCRCGGRSTLACQCAPRGAMRRPNPATTAAAPPTLQAGLLVVSGTCLCFHFGAWVFSVEATSLTHSLLFVSATPLFLAAGTWLLRKPISAGELAGTAAGLAGGVLLATAAARSDAQVTVRGDLAALSASLAFVGYLLIGQRLRTWMPLFVYASWWVGGRAGEWDGRVSKPARVQGTASHVGSASCG
jgi:drug/metabolite transporter (DMT)-like permease